MRKGSGLVRDVFQQHHMLELQGQHRHRPRALPDRRLRQRLRGAAVLRQRALRHLPRAQRQPHQRRRARRDPDPRGPPAPQHHLRLRGAAERVRLRAAARRHAAHHAGGRVRRAERGLSALPRRLRGRRDDHRPRHPRLPRPERHPPAGARASATRRAAPSGCWPPRAWRSTACRSSSCATSRPGEAVFIDEQGRLHTQQCVADACGTRRASSSTSTSRAPTRRSTTSRCTARACAWATGSPTRSCASARITTSTWSSRFRTPAAPARCSSRSGSA